MEPASGNLTTVMVSIYASKSMTVCLFGNTFTSHILTYLGQLLNCPPSVGS